MYNIHKNALQCQEYWCDLLDVCQKYVHANIKVGYENGQYMILEEYEDASCFLPKDAIIERINGLSIDDYANNLEKKVKLRFDADNKKSFVHHPSPFLICEDKSHKYWNVDFRLENGEKFNCQIPKKEGYRANPHTISFGCTKEFYRLTEDIGYLRVPFFPACDCIENDLFKLDSLCTGNDELKSLIIDLRGNPGGIQKYGEELLIRPFISKPVEYTQYSAMKKHIYDQLKICYNISKITWKCDLNPGHIKKSVKKIFPMTSVATTLIREPITFSAIQKHFIRMKMFTLMVKFTT